MFVETIRILYDTRRNTIPLVPVILLSHSVVVFSMCMIIMYVYYKKISMRINQYVVYTSPVKIVDDFAEACKLADDYFNETGYIVAVEETNPVVYPEYEIA